MIEKGIPYITIGGCQSTFAKKKVAKEENDETKLLLNRIKVSTLK